LRKRGHSKAIANKIGDVIHADVILMVFAMVNGIFLDEGRQLILTQLRMSNLVELDRSWRRLTRLSYMVRAYSGCRGR